ncbi:hypothetical protein WA556_003990 [Blastocystis sp. ATCC 50177/Nand II]
MTDICPAGIDFGNLCTFMSVFQTNPSEPLKSVPIIVADRNGKKELSSEMLFTKGKRLSATAASVVNEGDRRCRVRYIKSSIKRPYAQVSEDVRIANPSMTKDDKGNVQYSVLIENQEEKFWPSHLAGSYISDRIEDIKKDRKADKLNLVLSIPRYFTEEQINDFKAGLVVSGITEYILIQEPDAVAVEYGYYLNLSHQFDEKPMTVLFVGVGYSASQAFVVQYTKDHFKILHYASSLEVSSSKIDSILLDLVIQSYDDQKGDGDPDIRGNGDVYYRLFPRLLKLKMDFSHDDTEYGEIAIPAEGFDDETYVDCDYPVFEEQLTESGIGKVFGGLVEECLSAVEGTAIDHIEVCDAGVFNRSFKGIVNAIVEKHGIAISIISPFLAPSFRLPCEHQSCGVGVRRQGKQRICLLLRLLR